MDEFKVGKSFQNEESFASFLGKVITSKLPVEKWNKENVVKAIEGCRRDFGIPQFVTGFAGRDFGSEASKGVMMRCWGGKNNFGTVFFSDVPKETHEELKKQTGDWKILIGRYAPEKEIELKSLPIMF